MKQKKALIVITVFTLISAVFMIFSCTAANSAIGLYLPFLPGNVAETPVITASSSTLYVGESVSLSAAGSGEEAIYNWTVAAGDGTIDATGESVTYTASSTAGSVTVTCYASITDYKDSNSAAAELTVSAKILTSPSISGQTMVLPGDTAVLTASGSEAGAAYNWSVYSGGTIDATGSSVTYTAPASEGTVTISCYSTLSGFTDSTPTNYTLPIRDNHFALLTSTTVSGGSTNLNQGAPTSLEWSNVSIDSSYFTLTAPTTLQVEQAGSYFLAFTIPVTSGLIRSAVKAEVYVNSSAQEGTIAESSYIRNESAHGESSDHLAVFLHDLSVGDVIEIKVSAGSIAGTVTIDSQATLYVEYLDSSRTLFSATATETESGTNLNKDNTYTLKWTEVYKDSGFSHSDSTYPEEIQLDQAGYYLVFVNLPLHSTLSGPSSTTRYNVKMLVQLNGSTVAGGEAQQGYIRNYNTGQHFDSSAHWSGLVYSPSASGKLEILPQRETTASTGTVTTGSGKASIHIEKIDSAAYLLFSQGTTLTGGTPNDWNSASAEEIEWSNDSVIDTAQYSHDTGASSESITFAMDGDYFLIYNDSLIHTGVTDIRMNPKIRVEINGTPVPGAETKTHYIRNERSEPSGNTESSGSLVYYLNAVSVNDVLTVTVEQEGEAGAVDDNQPALLTLIRKN